jgi:glucose-6-phosphate 1-dehydrogenase
MNLNAEDRNTNPTTVVIFGATGDLTQRRLVPALFNLFRKKHLPPNAHIVGFARRSYSHDQFRAHLLKGLHTLAPELYDPDAWSLFSSTIRYVRGDFDTPEDYCNLRTFFEENNLAHSNCVYYMATAPEFVTTIVENLARQGMTEESRGWRRTVLEKPFGHDLLSANELNRTIRAAFEEHQIYRIDHYLGKETAQNILFFRFANAIFEPLWNRNLIDNIQISVTETVDVGHRGEYYDKAGVLRDMFQNHLLQLLALVAMEPPASFKADAVRDERVKLLSAIRPITTDEMKRLTVLGQYKGYRDVEGVARGSRTPTYAAFHVHIDNWRWQGVPFYLRSGKALAEKGSHIAIQFRCPPHLMFPEQKGIGIQPNLMVLCLQPDEGMHLRFEIKVPETLAETRSVDMTFHYEDAFGPSSIPDAYVRLLLDVLNGDASLFTRSDTIEAAWRWIDPIIQYCEGPDSPKLALYEKGSWGPGKADEFMALRHRHWYKGCRHVKE